MNVTFAPDTEGCCNTGGWAFALVNLAARPGGRESTADRAPVDAAQPNVVLVVIDTLRARWREIDRLGGAGHRALWQRFDAALNAAYEPVAAHVAGQRAARETNLTARRQLLDVLEAVGVVATTGSAESAEPATPEDDTTQPETKNEAPAEFVPLPLTIN